MTKVVVKDETGKVVSETLSDTHQNCVEITENAKGDRGFKIRAYHDDPAECERLLELYFDIAIKYTKRRA